MVAKNPIRIALWAGPRDISTLMLYSFAQRQDANVLDEPLHGYYLGYSGQDRIYREEVIQSMDVDPDRILDTLVYCDLNKPLLFIKNITNQIIGLQWDFILNFKNVLLIQSPELMLKKYNQHIPNLNLLDTSYEVQYHLMLYLIEQGIEPIVVEESKLLANPTDQMEKLCKKLNISFDPEMMQWGKGAKSYEGVWAEYWYQKVRETGCFEDYPADVALVPDELEPVQERANPIYEKLKMYAI